MNRSAALMNDVNRTVYTYAIQIPYLNTALQELQEIYEQNSVSVTQLASAVIQVDAGETEIEFNVSPLPELPDDFIEPVELWERLRDTDPFIPMRRLSYLPHQLEGVLGSAFIYFVWQNNKIIFLESNQDNDIKIDYIRQLFSQVTVETDEILVINAATFLQFRTASLLAEYVEENDPRASNLRGDAELALDRALGIGSKSKQSIFTRRRPFRQSYKGSGWGI